MYPSMFVVDDLLDVLLGADSTAKASETRHAVIGQGEEAVQGKEAGLGEVDGRGKDADLGVEASLGEADGQGKDADLVGEEADLEEEVLHVFEAEHLPSFARTYALPRKMKRRASLDQANQRLYNVYCTSIYICTNFGYQPMKKIPVMDQSPLWLHKY